MFSTQFSLRRRSFLKIAAGGIGVLLTGCGGSSGGGTRGDQNTVIDEISVAPPQILLQPSGQTVGLGESATFEVNVSGDAPLTYQWRRDDVDIPGAVETIYITPSLTLQENGSAYTVLVLNSAGTVQSNVATLNISTLNLTVDSTFASADLLSISL